MKKFVSALLVLCMVIPLCGIGAVSSFAEAVWTEKLPSWLLPKLPEALEAVCVNEAIASDAERLPAHAMDAVPMKYYGKTVNGYLPVSREAFTLGNDSVREEFGFRAVLDDDVAGVVIRVTDVSGICKFNVLLTDGDGVTYDASVSANNTAWTYVSAVSGNETKSMTAGRWNIRTGGASFVQIDSRIADGYLLLPVSTFCQQNSPDVSLESHRGTAELRSLTVLGDNLSVTATVSEIGLIRAEHLAEFDAAAFPETGVKMWDALNTAYLPGAGYEDGTVPANAGMTGALCGTPMTSEVLIDYRTDSATVTGDAGEIGSAGLLISKVSGSGTVDAASTTLSATLPEGCAGILIRVAGSDAVKAPSVYFTVTFNGTAYSSLGGSTYTYTYVGGNEKWYATCATRSRIAAGYFGVLFLPLNQFTSDGVTLAEAFAAHPDGIVSGVTVKEAKTNNQQGGALLTSVEAAYPAPKEAAFLSAAPRLDSNIDVVIEAFVPAGAEDVRMKFTLGGKETVVNGVSQAEEGVWSFLFSDILPQQISQTLSMTLLYRLDGEDKSLSKTDYSIQTYCEHIRASEQYQSDTKLMALIDALLCYGEQAQIWLDPGRGAKTVVPVDDGYLEAVPVSLTNSSAWTRACLLLENSICLLVETSLDEVTVSIGGRQETLPVTDGEILFHGICANEFDRTVTITGTDGEGTDSSLTYSVNTYICRMLGSGTLDEKTENLIASLYNYGAAASAYAAAH